MAYEGIEGKSTSTRKVNSSGVLLQTADEN